MKPKSKTKQVNVGTPVREEKTVEPEETKPQPVKVEKSPTVYRVKCVWSGPVKVRGNNTPSGTAYSFQPQETQGNINEQDALYLAALGQDKPGCCSGSGTPRRYFELV